MKSRVISAAAILAAAAAFVPAQAGGPPNLPNFDRRSPIVLAVENVGPAVVSIKTQTEVRQQEMDPWFGLFQQAEPEVVDGHSYRERAQGSGVIIHPYGYLVTNNHVIGGADRITVTLQNGGAGKSLEAALVNADRENDIAILKIKQPGPYPYALMGDSEKLLVGETTIALGNPFGLASSATTGILSAKNRSVDVRGKLVFKDFIQTSALINPGNSGGPLLDINGYVIGINVAIDLRGPGICYAIPINRVREVAANLLDPEVVTSSWIGLDVAADKDGLRVDRIADNGPASHTPIKKGDLIVGVGPKRVDDRLGMNIELLQYQPGSSVPLMVHRDQDVRVDVRLEAIPVERLDSVGLVVSDISDLTPSLAATYGLEPKARGVVITKVVPGSIADQTRLAAGDVVVQLGGYRVPDASTLANLIRTYARRYRSAQITVLRKGEALSGSMPLS